MAQEGTASRGRDYLLWFDPSEIGSNEALDHPPVRCAHQRANGTCNEVSMILSLAPQRRDAAIRVLPPEDLSRLSCHPDPVIRQVLTRAEYLTVAILVPLILDADKEVSFMAIKRLIFELTNNQHTYVALRDVPILLIIHAVVRIRSFFSSLSEDDPLRTERIQFELVANELEALVRGSVR